MSLITVPCATVLAYDEGATSVQWQDARLMGVAIQLIKYLANWHISTMQVEAAMLLHGAGSRCQS
jgi:hypothetical protein